MNYFALSRAALTVDNHLELPVLHSILISDIKSKSLIFGQFGQICRSLNFFWNFELKIIVLDLINCFFEI